VHCFSHVYMYCNVSLPLHRPSVTPSLPSHGYLSTYALLLFVFDALSNSYQSALSLRLQRTNGIFTRQIIVIVILVAGTYPSASQSLPPYLTCTLPLYRVGVPSAMCHDYTMDAFWIWAPWCLFWGMPVLFSMVEVICTIYCCSSISLGV
jgi:hypothetical protein